jgi:predicted nucleic acid-binding protein
MEVFKRGPAVLIGAVAFRDVVTCLPIVQEILQGFRDEARFRVARTMMAGLPTLESPMGEDVFLEAASLHRAARRAGITPRSSVDCLIATCAVRQNVEVLHKDRDFAALARVSPLRQRVL